MSEHTMKNLCCGILILATVVFGLMIIPACLLGLLAVPMGFDSGARTAMWFLAYSIWSFPVVALISIGVSWFLYRKDVPRSAIAVSALPLVNILIAVIAAHYY
jgi:hypothetical protein